MENQQCYIKRMKTEEGENRNEPNRFDSIYKKLKKKNPGLSIQSYFIASLHSLKATDMYLVNTGSDADLNFVFQPE